MMKTTRTLRRLLTFLALAFGLLAPAAQAANITRTYSFVATNFNRGPETRVTGSFKVIFDPTVSVTNQATGVIVNNLSAPTPYTGAALFTYNASNGRLTIGANSVATEIDDRVADFWLVVDNASTAPTYTSFSYTKGSTLLSGGTGTISGNTVFGDDISGGWLNGLNFTIGEVGTTADTNNWPAAESPDKAADGDASTKFLLFKNSNAGFIFTPGAGPATYNRLALTTAGDAPERDPASYIIYGSTTRLPFSGNIAISSLTLIQQGTLALTDARNIGPALVQFNNTTAYASYVVVFPTIKNSPASSLTQIAEVKLSQGLTVPNQVLVGKARGGQLVGNSFTLGSIGTSNPANNWPAGQAPDHALDGSISSQYLLFQNNGAGLIVAPEAGPTVINSLSFWTAGDAPERDPLTYKVYGSTSTATGFSGAHGVGSSPWTLIKDTTSVTLPAARNTGPTTVNFTNTTAYTSYLVVFPTVKSTSGNTITQIADVAFAATPTNAAPTNIALSGTTISENNAAGATIGTLTATDPDAGQTHTFSFGGHSGYSLDNAAFTITGNTLTINASQDFETKSSYTIAIVATDNGSPTRTFEKEFIITITDVTIPQTITFGAIANKTFGDAPFTVSATGGASGQPVLFSIENGPATIAGNTVTITGAGTVNIRATQAGAGDYLAAPYALKSFYVNPQPQTITFGALANKTFGDAPFTVSATGGASGQPVVFSIPGGPATVLGNTVTLTGAGTVTVRATQAGSANYDAAIQVDQNFTVAQSPQTITFNLATTALTTDSVPLTATTTGVGVGPVFFAVVSGPGSIASDTLTFSGPGAVVVRAYRPGNQNYLSATEVQRTITASAPVASETITIGGTTVLSAANIGTNATVPELLSGQTIITGTVNPTDTQDRINFTLPPGKAVLSGMLTISNYVAAIPPSGNPILSRGVLYGSSSAFDTRSDTNTTTSFAVSAPTRCNTSTFRISIEAPLEVRQQFIFIPPSNFVPGPILSAYGSASYVLTLEIGDQQTDSTLSNLTSTNTTLSPAFAPATTLYTGTIPFTQTHVNYTRIFGPLQYATLRVNGSAASAINSGASVIFGMNVGLNTIVTTVCAQDGTETTYTMNITREPDPNLPPTFSGYAFSMAKNTQASVAVAKILARAADADGGTLSITAVSNPSAQGNIVSLNAGNILFTPASHLFTGLDTFTVTIEDGQGASVVGTVTVNVTDPGQSQNQAQISMQPGGDVALLFMGIPGQEYVIERSTDLQNWSALTTVTAQPDGSLPFTDEDPPPGTGFYRTALPNG